MTKIYMDTDLNDGKINTFDGWETCAAMSATIVIYTGNWFAAYSDDGGTTFKGLDPFGLCASVGESFCCDQVVVYIPKINQFAWLMQTVAGNYVLALATPQEIQHSQGTTWATLVIYANQYTSDNPTFDYPELAVGTNHLYLACDLSGAIKGATGLRLSLAQLVARGTVVPDYIVSTSNWWLRPVQNTGDIGYFVAQNSASQLRVFVWPEGSGVYSQFDVDIATIPTEDFPVQCLGNRVWLDSSNVTGEVEWHIYGATLTGSQLWCAWNGARKISGQSSNTFNYPHIGIAVIDVQAQKLINQRYLYNDNFALAWPSLATDPVGNVGISCCWGGGRYFPRCAVGMLTGPDQNLYSISRRLTTIAGGHYTSIRQAFGTPASFCASGFVSRPKVSNPHFVLFGP